MQGNLILAAIPVLLIIIGAVCSVRGNKLIFSLCVGAAVFAVTGLCAFSGGFAGDEGRRFELLGAISDSVSYDSIAVMNAPPAYLLIMKICSLFSQEPFLFPLVTACLQAVLAAAVIYTRCGSPYAGGAVLAACFMPTFFVGSATFTAALICIFASKYIEERRFFRYAAVILMAACFDAAAVVIIFFAILIFSQRIHLSVLASVVTAAAAVLFPGITDEVFGLLGTGRYTVYGITVPCAAVCAAGAVIVLLMRSMIRNRGEGYERLIPVMVCGAAFSAAAVFDGRLFSLSLLMLAQSSVVLAPEVLEIGKRFTSILFPDRKKSSQRAFAALCAAILCGICVYFVFGNCFGSDHYDAVIHAGVFA